MDSTLTGWLHIESLCWEGPRLTTHWGSKDIPTLMFLIHAIIDALLGAAGMGDIGMLFPDTDPSYEGVSSLRLLSETVSRITPLGFEISNVDVTLFAERPKIGPYREQIAQNVADAIGIHRSRINIKATTTEGLGFVGRQEGLAAAAVALLDETNNS